MRYLDPVEFWNSVPTEESQVWPVVCVDLNGVLDKYQGWNGKVESYPVAEGAYDFLKGLRQYFNTVVVFTATMPLEFAYQWLEKNKFMDLVDYVTNHKVPASVYIDDRAVTHTGDFEETLRKAAEFRPHWSTE